MMRNKTELIALVNNLAIREGSRPTTIGPAPHTQTNQFPEYEKYGDALFDYVMQFPNVENGISHIGDGGLRAFFIPSAKHTTGFTENFLVDNEFAHIHRHGSHSLHAVLPKEIGKIIEEMKWGENHPLSIATKIPATNYMLYGSRNEAELDVQKTILEISYLFATKQW
jgi:hypothetical protein